MTITDLKSQIMKDELSNFYIFTGTEIGIMNIYLQQMSKKLKMPITRAPSVLAIYGKCMGGNMFGDETGFYVIRDDKDFPKNEKAYETIKKNIGKNVIVLLYEKVDSRLKFGKHFKEDTVAFEKLSTDVLKSYIRKSIDLSEHNIETLVNLCSGSYDMCMLEVDKIKQFHACAYDDKQVIPPIDEAFFELLNSGIIYQPQEYDVFKFTDSVMSKDTKRAFELERNLRENGVNSVTLLGTLYNSLKSTMLIQCCTSNNISEVTGLDKGQIYFSKKYKGNYSIERLVYAVKLVSETISNIKSGYIEDSYATKYVLASIM